MPDVDIALENEKKRKLLKQQKEAEILKAQKLQDKREAELQAREARELEKKKEKEQQARDDQAERKARELAQKAEARKQEAKQLAIEKEQDKRTAAANAAAAAAADKQKQAAADKQKAVAAAAAASQQKQAAAAAAASEKQHQEAVKRIMGMAGAGNADGGGTSAKASGPSAGYAGKVRAKVLPNVVFTDDIAGNPVAEVRVTTTADGTIMSQSLTKSSGNKAWDEAVIKAIIRTGSLPRDVDGQVPTPITLVFRPN
ncbi:MAG: Cell division and transport-associated protein TolA [Polaromonas sp.]|nr:Cell division and transport-associated protein TolA [Polaromonas sp.]